MGPVEQQLREQLRQGRSVSRGAASRAHGMRALVILDRFCRRGIAEREGDLVKPRLRALPSVATAIIERRERAQAQADAARAAQAERERQRREITARLDAARTDEERRRIVAESRVLALASAALPAVAEMEFDAEEASDLFGLHFDSEV